LSKFRHYEVVLLIHPDRSDQINVIVDRYKGLVTEAKGTVHRYEDWGRRQLAYAIKKVRKAHYILMNIECPSSVMEEIKSLLKFNDAVLRDLILLKDSAVTEPSPMLAGAGERPSRGRSDSRPSRDGGSDRRRTNNE
jgi:small subunit ribosomal protein S6